jgi:MFS family permease
LDEPEKPHGADAFAALRIPVVRSFALGRMASVIGAQIISVAVGYQLYERTHDAWALGLTGLFELLPVLVLMIPAGNAADRYPRRNVAMLAHLLLALAALGLAGVARAGPIPLIYALLVVAGTARAFASPSVSTLLTQLLLPEQFANANAWLSASWEIAAISGPALGGFVIAAFQGDPTWAFVTAAAGQLLFVALLARMPRVDPPPPTGNHDAGEIFAGFAFIRRSPVFLAAITLDLFAVLLGGAVALLPVFAKDILHVGPVGLGWLRAAPSLGAMLTALATTRLPPWKRPGRALLFTVGGFGLATIGFGLSRHLWLSLSCLFLTGVFDEVSVVIRMTLEQVITPDRLRGRVSAVNYVFIGFSNELGSFESGSTAALFGPVVSVVGGGIGTLVVVAIVALAFPALRAIGPLHTLKPVEVDEGGEAPEPERAAPAPE